MIQGTPILIGSGWKQFSDSETQPYYLYYKVQHEKITSFSIFLLLFLLQKSSAQTPPNWTKDQLLQPSTLAQAINSGRNVPVVFSVGPGALIPNSITIGMTNNEANLTAFKKQLKNYSKTSELVIYCGCCPFEHCPNVRPAIDVLNEMHFTNYKLLDLPHNLKADWIDKGYPTVKQ